MTRQEKLLWIEKQLPKLYQALEILIPNLVENPDDAKEEEIAFYNQSIFIFFKRQGYGIALIETIQF